MLLACVRVGCSQRVLFGRHGNLVAGSAAAAAHTRKLCVRWLPTPPARPTTPQDVRAKFGDDWERIARMSIIEESAHGEK